MHFKTYREKDGTGDWRWTLYANNHEKIADSAEGYKNQSDCLHGILLVKQGAPNAPINPSKPSGTKAAPKTILGGS